MDMFTRHIVLAFEVDRIKLAQALPYLAAAANDPKSLATALKELQGDLLGANDESTDIYKLAQRLGTGF